jgi:hypothetical protein
MTPHDSKSRRIPQIVLLAAVTLVAAVSGVAALARQVAEMGPRVGDIIAFDPAHPAVLDDLARLTAARPGGKGCVLDVGVIQKAGGSLIVEQRAAGADRLYYAHWAGPRTSDAASDCGTEADLVLSALEIDMLANAAGGFGANHMPVSLAR